MPDFKLDWERGRLVVARALSAFKNGEYPYQGRFLPQDLIPPTIREDPLRTAQLLFYSCHYMRGTIKAGIISTNAASLRISSPIA